MITHGRVVDLDTSLALSAAKLSMELSLPMADSFILATARAYDAILWTQDADFKDIEGVRYIEKLLLNNDLWGIPGHVGTRGVS